MSVEPKPDLSEFAEFADALHVQRVQSRQVVRHALARVSDHSSDGYSAELGAVSKAVDGALDVVERAVEELRMQNDALFAARTQLEGVHALFRDFFELAPAAYVVTSTDTRILYANHAACALFGNRKNALVGRLLVTRVPLENRAAFRCALVRSTPSGTVSEWPTTLLSSDARATRIACRMHVRAVATPGARNSSALYWNIMEETDEDLF